MLKTNKTYDAPDMKVYEVHTEGVMCQSYNDIYSVEKLIVQDEEEL